MGKAILADSLLALLAVKDGLNESFVDAVLTKERIIADVMRNEVQSISLYLSKCILFLDMYLTAIDVNLRDEEL